MSLMDSGDGVVTLDVRISGFTGAPVRLLAKVVVASGHTRFFQEMAVREVPQRRPAQVIVTDAPRYTAVWDLAFDESVDLAQAIVVYRQMVNAARLRLDDAVAKYNPQGVLEVRKIDANGIRTDLDTTSLTNGHVAVLVGCWAAHKASLSWQIMDQDDGSDLDDDPSMPYMV